MAEWTFGSTHRQNEKNRQRAEQEQRSAHGRAINKGISCMMLPNRLVITSVAKIKLSYSL